VSLTYAKDEIPSLAASLARMTVEIEILYCRLCHTDIHTAHSEWDGLIYPNGTIYPCVPGHEIVGRVTSVGPDAKRFKVGEVVAVGTMVDSRMECAAG
jgi:alcohol dehydrogenase (NADP+)